MSGSGLKEPMYRARHMKMYFEKNDPSCGEKQQVISQRYNF
jgi:hypothetical protein